MNERHQVAIAGMGLAALTTAARLTELGITEIALYANGFGGTPYIAAINFVLPDNPYGDTPEQYCEDMIHAGYEIGNRELVQDMARHTVEGYELLRRWGVTFAHNADGSIKLRHVSGHTYPRSLCQTTELIGEEIMKVMLPKLEAAGVKIYRNCQVVDLLTEQGAVAGMTVREQGKLRQVYAPVVVAAWGGAGNLLGKSTYPGDIQGNTLGIAKKAGAEMVDMEFMEFEPLVILDPPGAAGEPSPTAMLGEGGYLRNAEGERFLLRVRPQGEAGASKSLINREAWKEVQAGKGSPHGGVYLDLRHVDRAVLKSYPWFFDRLMRSGCDPNEQQLEIGPMVHSFSGGIQVNLDYASNVPGLYAVGEACGGIHGACRCAGNAGSQAALSGMLCAEGIARNGVPGKAPQEQPVTYREDLAARERLLPKVREIGAGALGIYRSGKELAAAGEALDALLQSGELRADSFTEQSALSIRMILQAALNRRESRGTHNRLDYPEMDPAYEREFTI